MAALSRYTQPNQEINCYAAAAKYLEDNPDAKADLYPAWLHYVDIGKAEGRAWPSGLYCIDSWHRARGPARAAAGRCRWCIRAGSDAPDSCTWSSVGSELGKFTCAADVRAACPLAHVRE